MKLAKYHQKRNFNQTSEPKGKIKRNKSTKLLYVIQKHAASHLHYDFRLELNGVLLSWAVPKGPCLDPSVKRLAMHVEDHPLEYGSFEGTIPKGQYDGGTVMLWDTGEWIPEDENPQKAYRQGNMKLILKGEKLKGLWKLIRINQDDKTWLLIKGKDKYAKDKEQYDVTVKKPNSVLSKKSLEKIAENDSLVKSQQKTALSKKVKFPFKLTHPDKILYPEDKISKEDIAQYYDEVQEWILPYIINRPLTLVRCPTGYKKCFYQKHLASSAPKSLYGITLKEKNGKAEYIYLKDAAGLFALSQLGVLEIHPWDSRIEHIEYPDVIIFDLDPSPEVKWKQVVEAAKEIKKSLSKLKLKSFVRTTGGKGLHVVVPIKPEHDWETIKNFAKVFVTILAQKNPNKYISNMSKQKRKGKIFIDYLRNQRGATSIAPFSTRARQRAPVSTPLAWNELTSHFEDTFYTIKTLPNRLKKLKKDPWEDFFKTNQSLNLNG